MRYQRVRWIHRHDHEPVVLYSEIDDEGWELRKVEEYRDGRFDLADEATQTGSTILGETSIPPLAEINSQREFEGATISQEQFEAIWDQAREWHHD